MWLFHQKYWVYYLLLWVTTLGSFRLEMKVGRPKQLRCRWKFNSCFRCHKTTSNLLFWCFGLRRDGTFKALVVGDSSCFLCIKKWYPGFGQFQGIIVPSLHSPLPSCKRVSTIWQFDTSPRQLIYYGCSSTAISFR